MQTQYNSTGEKSIVKVAVLLETNFPDTGLIIES